MCSLDLFYEGRGANARRVDEFIQTIIQRAMPMYRQFRKRVTNRRKKSCRSVEKGRDPIRNQYRRSDARYLDN